MGDLVCDIHKIRDPHCTGNGYEWLEIGEQGGESYGLQVSVRRPDNVLLRSRVPNEAESRHALGIFGELCGKINEGSEERKTERDVVKERTTPHEIKRVCGHVEARDDAEVGATVFNSPVQVRMRV